MPTLLSLKRRIKTALKRLPVLRGGLQQTKNLVRDSRLFDDQWYLDSNPDVKRANIDPLDHYLSIGWIEGRNPNRLFDTKWYLERYPDVRNAGVDPLLHYIRHGCVEPRDAGPNFRPSLAGPFNSLRGAHHLAAAAKFASGIAETDTSIPTHSPALRILIVAELSIPQCRKYRIDQKQELLKLIGYDSTVLDWHDSQAFAGALMVHSAVIFYRVPGVPSILQCIAQARSLGYPTFWEVDDLIFDPNEYITNSNLETIDRELQKSVLIGVPLYRDGMLACENAIASTRPLADAMRKAGVQNVSVVENAIDDETTLAAEKAIASRRPKDSLIIIGYGSGTKTHDKDFLEATPALVFCLGAHPHLRLRIIGELNLSDELFAFSDQIEFFPAVEYDAYLSLLADCDIAIAPLEPSVFNNSKSNIKYIEASILDIPSICSSLGAFSDVIENDTNGLLASNFIEWRDALQLLIESPERRSALAAAAKSTVLSRYSLKNIAKNQLAPIFQPFKPVDESASKTPLRILSVNIFFHPQSYGGATIIAEQMAHRLNNRSDTEVIVFTSAPPGLGVAYDMMQYHVDGIPVFAVIMPEHQDIFATFEDPYVRSKFREVVLLTNPDVVHFHSIQNFGADLLEVCSELNVPIVVTVHDAWWICYRQFMVTGEGVYCFQRKIDLNICSACVPEAGVNVYRQFRLRRALDMADLILTPSNFFREIYLDNEFPAAKLKVNKNGVKEVIDPVRTESSRLRFGFVGGNSDLKGARLIREAFSLLERNDYECVLVDNALGLGYKSIYKKDWPVQGELTILPNYTQENMDDFYSRIDVLLFPTQWKESFGLTVREALIRNIWVITTDAGGVVEDVVDGENGTIIPLLSDSAQLADAIGNVLDRYEDIKRHVNPYRSSITTYETQSEELRDLLASVLLPASEIKAVGRSV